MWELRAEKKVGEKAKKEYSCSEVDIGGGDLKKEVITWANKACPCYNLKT